MFSLLLIPFDTQRNSVQVLLINKTFISSDFRIKVFVQNCIAN
jgi:hypothetical protein